MVFIMSAAHYIDTFVIPIPRDKVEDYRDIATSAVPIWKQHGALDYRECIGDDLEVERQVTFPQLVGTEAGETVIFATIVDASKEARDSANETIMADPRVAELCESAQGIIDFGRMTSGGFRTLVHLS
ncbi:MAG: hypothetical protein ACI8XO_000051 [Verrucomicrobiales bacterium]|jgi:uncharacterized protein YbaA (DUF1428 family)